MSLQGKLDKQVAKAPARLICEDVDVAEFKAGIAAQNAIRKEVGAELVPDPPKDCPVGTVLGSYKGIPVVVGVLPDFTASDEAALGAVEPKSEGGAA